MDLDLGPGTWDLDLDQGRNWEKRVVDERKSTRTKNGYEWTDGSWGLGGLLRMIDLMQLSINSRLFRTPS